MKKKFIYSFVLMNLSFSFVYSGGENNREDFIEKLMHDYNYVCQVNDGLRKEMDDYNYVCQVNDELRKEIAFLRYDNNELNMAFKKLCKKIESL